jgi:hypothetical protein
MHRYSHMTYVIVHRTVILSHSTHIICLVMYLIVLSTLLSMQVLYILRIIIMDFENCKIILIRSE